MDSDGSDIFVYADDLIKTGVERDYLRTAKFGNVIRYLFNLNKKIHIHLYGILRKV